MTVLSQSPITLDGLSLSSRDDATHLEIMVEQVQGWGSPGTSKQRYKKPRQHGAWSGEATLLPRTVVLNGYIAAPDGTVLQQGKDALNAAAGLDDVLLQISENGFTRHCMASRSDEILYNDASDTWADFSIQLIADDPRKYGDVVQQTTALASTTGGLTYPITYPIVYTGVTATGIITVNNTGNIDGPVVLRIDGPVQNPIVQQVVGIEVITFAMTYSIASGNWITVDMENESVLENDQASRAGQVSTRGFMSLQPGLNQFVFTSGVYNASAMLTVTTNPSWM